MQTLYVYADFDWLKEVELVGELGYESLRGSDRSILNRERTYSDVFQMPCRTVGDGRFCCVENRLRLQKKNVQCEGCHLSTF